MFKVTPEAANQIQLAATQGGSEGLTLRLAAMVQPSGAIDYKMGFDESTEDDVTFVSEGVQIAIAPEYVPVLDKVTLDFVTLDDGEQQFIFINPEDANYQASANN